MRLLVNHIGSCFPCAIELPNTSLIDVHYLEQMVVSNGLQMTEIEKHTLFCIFNDKG